MKRLSSSELAAAFLVSAFALCASARADPVVFTAYTVTDGTLGSLNFSDAPVTITFRGDTGDISMAESGGVVVQYRIDLGHATVAVTVLGKTTVAQITDGQIYVHYDVQAGVIGFGSTAPITNPYYPLTLACSHPYSQCYYNANGTAFASNQIVSALARIDADSATSTGYSGNIATLPQTLTQSGLFTGYLNACWVTYFSSSGPPCPSRPPAARAIQTDLGGLLLQDATLGKGMFSVEVGKERD